MTVLNIISTIELTIEVDEDIEVIVGFIYRLCLSIDENGLRS